MSDKKTANGFAIHKGDNYSGIFGKPLPTPWGRAAFVSTLVTPAGKPTPKYGLALLVSKTDETQLPEIKAIKDMIKLMALDLWGEQAANMLKKITRPPFKDGDEPSSTGKIYDGYAGNWVMNLRNKHPKGHQYGFKLLPEGMEPEHFEAGMPVRAFVTPYLNSDGVSYSLMSLKYLKDKDDGLRFGGIPDTTSALDSLDEAASAVNADTSRVDLAGLL